MTSSSIRRLSAKWKTGQGWPKRLERLAIHGLRGWTGQEFKMNYGNCSDDKPTLDLDTAGV